MPRPLCLSGAPCARTGAARPDVRRDAMSVLAASLAPPRTGSAATRLADVQRLLAGAEGRTQAWHADGVAFGVARPAWQADPALEGTQLIAVSERAIVAADASIYAVDGGRIEAGGPDRPPSVTTILRAWEAWGDDCAGRLDGDYAFMVWDRQRRRALLARDIVGRRALYVRRLPRAIALASRAATLARALDPPALPNLPLVAAAASSLPGGSEETGYLGVLPVPAGATMTWSAEEGLRLHTRWEPPPFQVHGDAAMELAAEELRVLLTASVTARVSPSRTVVWLSGGADSTAVYAAAMAAAGSGVRPGRVGSVSVSYPVGDMGREDDYINEVAARWGGTPRWIDAEAIDLFDGIERRARERDDPFAHTFDVVNRTLAAATAAGGDHVALDGYGGDPLFEVSRLFAADLLLDGDPSGWWRAVRGAGYDAAAVLRWGALPALPEWCWEAVEAARGRPLGRPYRYPLVSWLTRAARAELEARGWQGVDVPRRAGEGPAAYESRVGLVGPHYARALASTRDQTASSGVEVRSPFMERRLIGLAASRPVAERGWKGNNKRLLKAAMRGLIPDSVLAPRAGKTGLAAGYLHRQLGRSLRPRLEAVFEKSSALADAGLVEPRAVLSALAGYLATPTHLTGVALYLTLEAELWLRSAASSG